MAKTKTRPTKAKQRPGFYVYLQQNEDCTWYWEMEEMGDFQSDTVYQLEAQHLHAKTRQDAITHAKKWAEMLNISIDIDDDDQIPEFVLYPYQVKDVNNSWCWAMREGDDLETGLEFSAPTLFKDTREEAISHAKAWGTKRNIRVVLEEERELEEE